MPSARPIRECLRLDPGWKFHPGDVPTPPLANTHTAAYMANKAGYARGAAKGNFDDSDWRIVDLPHDWSVEGSFSRDHHLDAGYLPRGIGWYRRYFQLDESDRGRHLAIRFDAIATHCTVWVNGHLVHRSFCGYTPFTIDFSEIAQFGDQLNNIAVRVDATYPEGWWYEGAGIYRHVWLINSARQRIDDVFVRPERQDDHLWRTCIQSTIRNDSDASLSVRLVSSVIDPAGAVVNSATSLLQLAPRSGMVVEQEIAVEHPALWSLESRHLYQLQSRMFAGDDVVDEQTTRFGYRTIRFDAQRGFFLNDQPIKLKGTCNHQDHAGVGVAVPDSIHRFRIQRLKEMGCNAYRCAHNPPAKELLDACDELGMLVMDENRNFGASLEHLSQLRAMVLRDRNHPCVILWSICNEEAIQGTPVARRIAQTMVAEVKKLDRSRPVTAAISGGILNDDCLAGAVEVMGINYQPHLHEPFHRKHPAIPLVAAETHCALSTRGVYQTDPRKQVFDSYDTSTAPWGQTSRDTWRAVRDRGYVAGLFIWTGFDYRGEPSPHEWPSISSHWGLLDTCGFEKDLFHLHRAYFTAEPFVHLLPHWNAPVSDPVRVMACTNCDEVELLLDSRSLGRKSVDPIEMVDWQVTYEPGELRAVGFRNGARVCETLRQTTGPAAALGMEIHASAEMGAIRADGESAIPVTVFALDTNNRRVPDANHRVLFEVDGPGTILGVGNGDPNCHEPDKASARSLFNGLAQVIVQMQDRAGEIVLTARAHGLKPAEMRLSAVASPIRPMLPPARVRHFISDWRMSPITIGRPDPNVEPSQSDMNTWERINPANGPQRAWENSHGYALYRATIKVPRVVQSRGGRIVFGCISGSAHVYLDSLPVVEHPRGGALEVALAPNSGAERVLVVLVKCDGMAEGGLAGPVEILPG